MGQHLASIRSTSRVCGWRWSNNKQGRIQDLKKEGAQKVRGRDFRHVWANLGDFLKNLAQKVVGVRPLRPPPSGSAPVKPVR